MQELLILTLAISMFALPKLGEHIRKRSLPQPLTYANRDTRGRFIRTTRATHHVIVKRGETVIGGFEI